MTESLRTRAGDQPLPTSGVTAVQDEAIAFLESRKKLGLQRYNSLLMTWNGRNSLQDALDEVADLMNYLTQLRMEVGDLNKVLTGMLSLADELDKEPYGPVHEAAERIRHFVYQILTPAPAAPKPLAPTAAEPPTDFITALIEQHRPVVRPSPMAYTGLRDVQCQACNDNVWKMIGLLEAIPECDLWAQAKALGLVQDATPTDAGE